MTEPPPLFTLQSLGYSTCNEYGMDGIHKIGYGFYGIGDDSMDTPLLFHGHFTLIPWTFHTYSTHIIPYGTEDL
jgi:hypothetical protein